MHSFIRLNSGNKFNFHKIDINSIFVEDIAHSLSYQCRFNGHSSRFYSVAEHCVRGAQIVPESLRLDFLLHDAAEAYIGDLSAPLKKIIPQFKKIEESIDRVISEKFGISYPHNIQVKKADLIMLATEMRDLMPGTDYLDFEYESLKEVIVPWPAELAKSRFLECFEKLKK